MSQEAVVVEGLGKRYRLGSAAHYGRLTESLTNALAYPFRRLTGRHTKGQGPTDLWALRDVSFNVRHGEAVGIIGRNGAGKTTLLKILSRITEPTEGRALLQGRVGSLLEVGTGFHPELTGRENVYLNGAILGMPRSEIQKRFAEIIEFSEIGPFMDTPVKKYSSGMTVRLAFAVAAHLDPEILIVDEVLAVGDVAFQRKCLGKIGDVASEGRTVLFVSHNMSVMTRLCERGIYLQEGKVAAEGPMEQVVREYLASSLPDDAEYLAPDIETAPGNDLIRLRAVRVRDHEGRVVSSLDGRYPIYIEIEHVVLKSAPLRTAFRLVNAEGTVLFTTTDADSEERFGAEREPGVYVSRCTVPPHLLKRGLYFISVSSSVPMVKVNFSLDQTVSFTVDQVDAILEDRVGAIAPALDWRLDRTGDVASAMTERTESVHTH